MLIWLAMCIPVLTATVLFLVFTHKTTWWELLLPIVASFFFCLGAKSTIEYYQLYDNEYWTGWATKAEYYEEWTEEYTTTTTDSKGRSHTETHHRWHAPEYYVYDTNELKIPIHHHDFEWLAGRWRNRVKTNLFHFNQSSWGDGDMFTTTYPSANPSIEAVVVTSKHTYKNKVAHSSSVFNFPEVNPKDYNLFNRAPHHLFNTACIESQAPISNLAYFDEKLQRANAEIGPSRQVRMLMLIFCDKPVQAAIEQQAYWKNGNKNEIVLCLGIDNNAVLKWTYVFSWSDSEDLKVNLRESVQKIGFNLETIIEEMCSQCKEKFVRKKFVDFEYITVDPPVWTVALTFFLTILFNVGLSSWIVLNEHNPEYFAKRLKRHVRPSGFSR